MQTTRPITAEATERRAGHSPVRRSHPFRTTFLVLLGVGSIAAAVGVSTGWLPTDIFTGNGRAHNPTTNQPIEADFAVGFGHVDVLSRIINLYPVQPGEVTEIPADIKENAFVKKGSVLFRMDDHQAKLNVQMAQEALEDAKLKLAQAEKTPGQHASLMEQQEVAIEAAKREQAIRQANYDEADRLFKDPQRLVNKEKRDAAFEGLKKAEEGVKAEEKKLASMKLQVDLLKLDIDRAKLDVSARKTRLDQAKYVLEKCELRAPCDGTILRFQVSVGDALGPNPKEPAVIFCPAQKRIIRAEVEQEFASKVVLGQSALIQDDTRSAIEWHGKVSQISDWYLPRRSIMMEPRQFNDVRTIECLVEVDDEKGLKIGQRVRVIFGK